mmetsp:Transcript_10325/g.27527  ORF Transcript_10325/g.27527 Transcript_10325/m.27527 type:complete len:310 (-) Transcript_10325:949-1878(-)
MSTTTGMLPSSATRQEEVAKRKSPKSVAAFSPTSVCAVASPRRTSAPSSMSSCTSEAECSTSTLAARDATRLNCASSARSACATRSVSAGLSRLPPVAKRRSTCLATSSLFAGAARPLPSNCLLTTINSRPTQRRAPSSPALGPCSGHAKGGSCGSGMGLADCGPLPSPAAIRFESSLSDKSFLWKPRPVPWSGSSSCPWTGAITLSKEGMYMSSSPRNCSNSMMDMPRTSEVLFSSVVSAEEQERSTRKASLFRPRTDATARMPFPGSAWSRSSSARIAERANQMARSMERMSSRYFASWRAQPRSQP